MPEGAPTPFNTACDAYMATLRAGHG